METTGTYYLLGFLIKAMIYAKSIERHGFMAAITFCQPCLPPRQKFTLPRARCLTIPAPRALPISNESSWKRKIEPFFSTERSVERFFFLSQKRILRWMFSSSKDRKLILYNEFYKSISSMWFENRKQDRLMILNIGNIVHWNNADFIPRIMDVSLKHVARCVEPSPRLGIPSKRERERKEEKEEEKKNTRVKNERFTVRHIL